MKTNVTVSLDAGLLRDVKVLAARRGTSISALLADALEQAVRSETAYAAAKERAVARLERGTDLGWTPPASRGELHERGA